MTEIREELHARHDYCWTNEAYQELAGKLQKANEELAELKKLYMSDKPCVVMPYEQYDKLRKLAECAEKEAT